MEDFTKFVNIAQAWAAGITAQQWSVAGFVIGFIFTTIGVTAYVKRRHLKKYAEKLKTEFIVLNVAFTGFVGTVATFVLTQGAAWGSLLPFIGDHWAQISGGAIAVHSLATALHSWWIDRKDNKPLTESNIPAVIQTAATELPAIDAVPQPLTRDIWTDTSSL